MREDWDTFFNERYFTKWFPRDATPETEAMARGAMALAQCVSGSWILDAPCGFGRHSLALARLGYRVTGADRSPMLIEHARRLSAELEATPEWLVADYRELPLRESSFDAVINLHTSLGFEAGVGDAQAIQEFHRVLRPGGSLVIEINHLDLFLASFSPSSEEDFGDHGKLIIERDFDAASRVNRMHHTRVEDSARETLLMEMRVYAPDELEALVDDAGFTSRHRFGSLNGDAFTPAQRLVIVAVK